jgi:hypothetical protein
VRISSDDRSLELPPSAWFSSSAEKYFFHFVIRAKPSCIPRAKPKCAPRAEPKCAPRAKPNAPRAKPNAPRAKPNAPRAKPRGGTVHRILVSASLDEQFISKVEVYTPSETEEALFFPFRSIGAYLI